MSKLTVSFINETNVSTNNNLIEESLKLILRRLGRLGRVNIELLVVEDSKIKELNTKYRNSNQATDVLSFPSSKAVDAADNLDGSIVMSADTAKKQAQQGGIPIIKEMQILAGHGLLHLLNYNHK